MGVKKKKSLRSFHSHLGPGKEPAQSRYAPQSEPALREEQYIMRSMLMSRPTARPNPRTRGAVYEVFPRTPDRLVVEFGPDQVTYQQYQGEGHRELLRVLLFKLLEITASSP